MMQRKSVLGDMHSWQGSLIIFKEQQLHQKHSPAEPALQTDAPTLGSLALPGRFCVSDLPISPTVGRSEVLRLSSARALSLFADCGSSESSAPASAAQTRKDKQWLQNA